MISVSNYVFSPASSQTHTNQRIIADTNWQWLCLCLMIFTPTNTSKGTMKAACWKSETRLKSNVRSPTVNMLQLITEFPDSSGRRAHRVQSWSCRTSPTKCVSIRRCAAPHGRDTDHRAQLGQRRAPLGTRSVHLLRWVNHTARRIRMLWRIQRASSMCWATSEVPWFLSKNALHRSTLTFQNTGNTQIRHLRSCLIRMIEGYFTHGAEFFPFLCFQV